MDAVVQATMQTATRYFGLFVNRLAYTMQSRNPDLKANKIPGTVSFDGCRKEEYFHEYIVLAWPNCSDSRGTRSLRTSKPVASHLSGAPCRRRLGRTRSSWCRRERVQHGTQLSLIEQLHDSSRREGLDYHGSRPVGNHTPIARGILTGAPTDSGDPTKPPKRLNHKTCQRVINLNGALVNTSWMSVDDRKEHIMSQSRGSVRFQPLFTTDDIGLRKDASIEHVVKVFLNIGEAIAARWIEMPRGVLLLQSVRDQPASGAVYLYDRERRIFFFVHFAQGRDDALTAAEFDQLVAEYNLVWWTANPEVLRASVTQPGVA